MTCGAMGEAHRPPVPAYGFSRAETRLINRVKSEWLCATAQCWMAGIGKLTEWE